MLQPLQTPPWPLASLLLALLLGWAAIAGLAAFRLARRRGLTLLAAILDPRGWTAEPVLGMRARMLLVAWTVALLAAALTARPG